MAKDAQRRAVEHHRLRMRERGMSRYEVRGLDTDKELVRGLARRLAGGDDAARQLRLELAAKVEGAPGSRGGVLAALRRSPLVGAGVGFERRVLRGRRVRL